MGGEQEMRRGKVAQKNVKIKKIYPQKTDNKSTPADFVLRTTPEGDACCCDSDGLCGSRYWPGGLPPAGSAGGSTDHRASWHRCSRGPCPPGDSAPPTRRGWPGPGPGAVTGRSSRRGRVAAVPLGRDVLAAEFESAHFASQHIWIVANNLVGQNYDIVVSQWLTTIS